MHWYKAVASERMRRKAENPIFRAQFSVRVLARERERERDRQTDRQTDRERD